MMTKIPERSLNLLSVVAPFHNEDSGAMRFHETLLKVLTDAKLQYELIYVDDGSKDSTLSILKTIAEQNSRVTVLSLSRNFGHQAALTAGLDIAKGDAVVSLDSDLQHPPEVIIEMLDWYQRGVEIVYAARENDENLNLYKRWTTNIFYELINRLSDTKIINGAADFRLMSKLAVTKLREMKEKHRFLRGMIPWLGFPSAVIYYKQPERVYGTPSYTFQKSLKLAIDGLFSFTVVPLRLITWLGFSLTILATSYMLFILFTAIGGQTVDGWASVIMTVLIIGGVQLISIGVIAQYTGMIFEEIKNRPLYVIKQKHLGETQSEKEGKIHE